MRSKIKLFAQKMPIEATEVFCVLTKMGLVGTVVGGCPRDFLLTGKVGNDWDIEVSSRTISFNRDIWKELGRYLANLGKVTILPYEVIRLDFNHFQFELSPPRKEKYHSNWMLEGHSNFDAEYDLSLTFEQSICRRDFTINTIGFRFVSSKDVELLDPLDGVRHIQEKILHPAGEDFGKDPVRFFRAIRFSRTLGFEFSSTLRIVLERMQIKTVSPAHLWSEMHKSKNPLGFYQDLLIWKKFHHEMRLPIGENLLEHREELRRILKDQGRHEMWIVALEWVGLSSEGWRNFFSLSNDLAKRLSRWATASKRFIQIHPESFQGEFEATLKINEFELLFDWYFTTKQLLKKNPELPLLEMIEEFVPEWGYLYRFDPVEDVRHIDPPKRAKYQVWNLCQRL